MPKLLSAGKDLVKANLTIDGLLSFAKNTSSTLKTVAKALDDVVIPALTKIQGKVSPKE
ncbi:MAG: hypothetical protein IJR10_05140 [Clostridia bacterium]|nr:hypothetical protein [Clostridia bacterium]